MCHLGRLERYTKNDTKLDDQYEAANEGLALYLSEGIGALKVEHLKAILVVQKVAPRGKKDDLKELLAGKIRHLVGSRRLLLWLRCSVSQPLPPPHAW